MDAPQVIWHVTHPVVHADVYIDVGLALVSCMSTKVEGHSLNFIHASLSVNLLTASLCFCKWKVSVLLLSSL